jgi:hypothetical protein
MSVTKASLLGDTFGNKASGTIPVGGIIMWSGTAIPTGWSLCDGSNGTPNLRNRFIVAADSLTKTGTTSQNGTSPYDPGDIGGSADAVVVSHGHTTDSQGSHIHSINYQKKLVEDTGAAVVSDLSFGGGDGDGGSTNETSTWIANVESNGPVINAAGSHSHSVNVAGESGTNKNLPPYYALAFIMRVS